MKKVVIAGSASLQKECQMWKELWEKDGYSVIDYPVSISKEIFLEEYPQVHKDFFNNIMKSDVFFVMNENKNDIEGYLGAESFAEMCFGVTQNLINNKNIEIMLLQRPDKNVQSYDEICLWLKLGWIKLYQK